MSDVDQNQNQWVHLKTGKEFSRMLYPNPVCFLSTISSSPSLSTNHAMIGTINAAAHAGVSENSSCKPSINSDNSDHENRNAMVLSWLTPTNNQGRFMFSINKSRYTTSLLAPSIDDVDAQRCRKRTHSQTDSSYDDNDCTNHFQTGIEFVLSVPVKGMEQLVLDTGSISGKFGSKFPSTEDCKNNTTTENEMKDTDPTTANLSNRQRKKLRKQQLSQHGVAGLIPIPLRSHSSQSEMTTSPLFAIKGTVAHLKCRTYSIIGTIPSIDNQNKTTAGEAETEAECDDGTTSSPIDNDHLLVMAEVLDAFVNTSYWDDKKLLFRPRSRDVPPYLTFFGSQTFGYVVSGDDESLV